MGIIVGKVEDKLVVFPLELFLLHMVILGATGMGKSVLLILMVLQFIVLGVGVTVIDPDNDTIEDLEAYIAQYKHLIPPERLEQIVIVEPGTSSTARLDPFADLDANDPDYDSLLATRIEHILDALARTHGFRDFQEMRRMKRVTRLILYLCGTSINGKYDGLPAALDWLNIGTKAWWRKYNKIREHLPKQVAHAIERLAEKPPVQREREIESSINLFDSFLSGPLIKNIVAPGPSIDFRQINREGKVLLVNVGVTDDLTSDQRRAVCALVFVLTHSASHHERVFRIVVVDEAASVLGHDYGDILRRARKRNEGLILCGTDLDSFKDERTDQRSVILSQPGTHIFFQTKGPKESLENIADLAFNRSMDDRLNWKPVQVGQTMVTIPEVSESFGTKIGETISNGVTHQTTEKREQSLGRQFGTEASQALETGTSQNVTHRNQTSKSTDAAETDGLTFDGENERGISSNTRTTRESESSGVDRSQGSKTGLRRGQSTRIGQTLASVLGFLSSMSTTHSVSREVAHHHTECVTQKNHFLSVYEWFPSGLLIPLEAQIGKVKRLLARLDRGQFVMMTGNMPAIKATVPQMSKPFAGFPLVRALRVSQLREWMRSLHPFFFLPTGEEKCPSKPKHLGAVSASKKRKGTDGSK